MSQDLRDYRLERIDERENEAREMHVTATVGPSVGDATRGVQITLHAPNGYVYGRVSEKQIEDLIQILVRRVDVSDTIYEATGCEVTPEKILPSGDKA